MVVSSRGGRFDPGKKIERALIIRPAAHFFVKAGHRFGVVIEDLGAGRDHTVDGLDVTEKVGSEHLHDGRGTCPHSQNAAVKMLGAAVRQVIAGDGCYHHMFKAQPRRGFGHPLRFIVGQFRGRAARDGTKAAGARANIAHDHESGSSPGIAFGPVRTARVLANRLQVQFTQQLVREEVFVSPGQGPAQPGWQPANVRGLPRNIDDW